MAGLDPAISFLIVIPAKAGIQLHFADAKSWTPIFIGVTKEGMRGLIPDVLQKTVMAGLDLAISGQRQITGSSPVMTYRENRHGRT